METAAATAEGPGIGKILIFFKPNYDHKVTIKNKKL